jgi:hypothetical protein
VAPRYFHLFGPLEPRLGGDEEVETEVRKWLRQQSKYFCAASFDALVKLWDKCISVGGRYVKKYIFFPNSNITCFTDSLVYGRIVTCDLGVAALASHR